MRTFAAILVLILSLFPAPALHAQEKTYDIVIYGGTSGGVAAAVQASRMGKTCILIEPTNFLGGLTTGGLGATDIGNKAAIGGISREFYQRIRKHYENESAWTREKRADFKGSGHDKNDDAGWTFEPHIGLRVMNSFVPEYKIAVAYGQRLNLKDGVKKEGTRIVAITMESGQTYKGRMFIDATYEGDLMAKAGVSYHVGREPNKTYGETLNGIQVKNATKHQFIKDVDPYVKPGDPSSGLIARVVPGPLGADGEGDNKVQAYNYRLCATDREENRRPWPKPENYDEKQYELLLRNFEAGDLRLPWNPVLMPNRKTDSNNNFAFSTDNIGMNYGYPDGDYATREKIIAEHISYQKGLMWTLANHPRVPEQVRKHFTTWGLAKDEFIDNDNWPRQLYVREARRMIGQYVMTEANCRGQRTAEDSVGMAAYTMDSHNIQRYVTKEGFVRNEGDVQVGGFSPYPISYGSIVPKQSECTNLFVPVCLSASHISYGSIRMEPVFMVMGQSAATAAAFAIDDSVDVQKVDYKKLRERLLADKQVLEWTGPKRSGEAAQAIAVKDLQGIVVDDAMAERKGFEGESSVVGPYVGQGYRHDGGERRGEQTIRFTPTLPKAGRYEVRLAYTANPNRATNAPVTIAHAEGMAVVKVDQKKAPPISKTFISLGVFRFEQGKAGYVEIGNAGVNGHVIADAVQFLAANDPTKWEKDIAAFEAKDKASPPKKGQILFVGSSSIRLWKLEKSFPGVDAINRGFGGSMIEDSTHFADRIVFPYEPRTIVFYAGDNDLQNGKTPEQVSEDFAVFVKTVRAKLPRVKIVNVAIKPSIARWKNIENIRKANALIRKQCEAGERMIFIDIDKPMMGEDGKPRAELFVQDGLHLSDKGYAVWDALVNPYLE